MPVMSEDEAQLDDVTFTDALAELQPYLGRTYAAIVIDKATGAHVMNAAGPLSTIQGDLDFAMILLGDDDGPRIDIHRHNVSRLRCNRGLGSLIIEIGGITLALSRQD